VDLVWLAVPVLLLAGALLAALTARRVRAEAAGLAAEAVALGTLADEAAAVRADAEVLAARTGARAAAEPEHGAR
jgi:hypothetical protein